MYQIWAWNDEANEYMPEHSLGKRVEFEHWTDATDEAAKQQAYDGIKRRIEFKRSRPRKQR